MTNTTPVFRNLRITGLTAVSCAEAGLIVGLPESPVSNVELKNIHIQAVTGLTIANAKEIILKKTQVSVEKGPPFVTDNAHVDGLPIAKPK